MSAHHSQPLLPIARLGLCGLALWTLSAQAADDFAACTSIADDTARLKCYDTAAHRNASAIEPLAVADPVATPTPMVAELSAKPSTEVPAVPAPFRSYLTRNWNLDGLSGSKYDETRIGRLHPFRDTYFIVRKTSRVNDMPTSPSPGHSSLIPQPTEFAEAKFQVSFKSEIASMNNLDLFGIDGVRLWAAYTQQSNWQAFNIHNSAAFRESNYEPEFIATFLPKDSSGALKLINFGAAHQSNGQSLPLSRSWNRFYLQGGWEWEEFSVLARGWWRVRENPAQDDNPNIEDYYGRGDLVLHWDPSSHQSLTLLLRNNLRLNPNRGFAQLDWASPLKLGRLGKLHVQATTGFGESMIDYNWSQTTLGVGFSFRDW